MSTFPLFMINEFNFLYLIQSIGYLRAEKESYFYRDICRRVYLIIPTVEQSFSTTTTSWYLFGVIHIFIIASVVNSSIITYIHIFIIGHLKSNITFTVLIYDRDNSTFYYAHSDTSVTSFKKTKIQKESNVNLKWGFDKIDWWLIGMKKQRTKLMFVLSESLIKNSLFRLRKHLLCSTTGSSSSPSVLNDYPRIRQ